MDKKIISTEKAPQAIGPYSQAIVANGFLFTSGMVPIINDIYKEYFNKDFPARSCVEVARLPKDVLIEIEAVAVV